VEVIQDYKIAVIGEATQEDGIAGIGEATKRTEYQG
jgi:hypothetical protein